jgi:tetratricopeptide (TPR) repeat protein
MCPTNKNMRFAITCGAGIALTFVFALSGCGTSVVQASEQQELATKANHRGEMAFQRGEYASAQASFEEALRIDQSIENIPGIAVNRLNLARTAMTKGDRNQAQQHLDALLKAPLVSYPVASLADASAMQAALCLSNGDTAAALTHIEKGQAWCAGSCNAMSSLLLLRAQIAMRASRPDEAIEHASNALRRLDNTKQAEEKANALRIIGEAQLEKKDPAGALARFEQALALDRDAGVPYKISLDLMYLGLASKSANRREDANVYFRRAAAVRLAAGDKLGAEQALRSIEPKE